MNVLHSCPSFINISEHEQVEEIAKYLHSQGAQSVQVDIPADKWQDHLIALCPELKTLDNHGIPSIEVEAFLNGIVSLFAFLPEEKFSKAVHLFCDVVKTLNVKPVIDESKPQKLAAEAALPLYKLKPLQNLFHILPKTSKLRFTVFSAMVFAAAEEKRLSHVTTERTLLRTWLNEWGCTTEEKQQLWRLLHSSFLKVGDKAKASACLIDLMDCYSDADASKSRDEAIQCIVSTLSDEDVYIMDHLLTLKPIRFLEGELIHNLLTIFVNGSLSDYMTFAEKHSDFVKQLNIDQNSCMDKMRLLTLMRLAENRQELDYNLLQEELRLGEDQLEEFIIDAARKEAVFCKLDEAQRRVQVYGTTHRTFGRVQWNSLRNTLQRWRDNLDEVKDCLGQLAPRPVG